MSWAQHQTQVLERRMLNNRRALLAPPSVPSCFEQHIRFRMSGLWCLSSSAHRVPSSIYLLFAGVQADKCRSDAKAIGYAETKAELQKLAH